MDGSATWKWAGTIDWLAAGTEAKIIKNRVHLDLQVTAATMDEEVARLEALGATAVRHVVNPPSEQHTVMQDPEGNEFCVVA